MFRISKRLTIYLVRHVFRTKKNKILIRAQPLFDRTFLATKVHYSDFALTRPFPAYLFGGLDSEYDIYIWLYNSFGTISMLASCVCN